MGSTTDGLPPAGRLIVLPSRAMAGIPIEALLALDDARTVSYASHSSRRISFQANTLEGARVFRLRKAFLGTSRMTIRTGLLRRIGASPKKS